MFFDCDFFKFVIELYVLEPDMPTPLRRSLSVHKSVADLVAPLDAVNKRQQTNQYNRTPQN